MRAMILAAGFGTRFRPVTYTLPKPMIPVLNRPLLGWALEACLESGFRELIVNVHHLPEPIREYLARELAGRASFDLSEEETILGTGGALRRVRDLLGEEFVLMNGDTIQRPPFDELVARRRAKDALACLLLREPPAGESFTRVWLDQGTITGFGEGRGRPLMFAGAHAISGRIVEMLPDKDFSGLTEDVYLPLVKMGGRDLAGLEEHGGFWFDVGTPMRYMAATAGLLRRMIDGEVAPPRSNRLEAARRVLHHDSAVVDGAASQSSLGSGSRLGAESSLERSVVWSEVKIGRRCRVEDSIMADGVEVPDGSVVQNALVSGWSEEGQEDEGTEKIGNWLVRPVDPAREWRFDAG